MRLAILSDIHASREAFSAVPEDAAQRGHDLMAILGDQVGHGPDPVWCVERVQALQAEGAMVLKGNHDAAIAAGGEGMNAVARAALDWTRTRLDAPARAWLDSLPLTAELDGIALAHALPADPDRWPHVQTADQAAPAFAATAARLILVGHVHVPMLVGLDRAGRLKGFRPKPGQPQPLIARAPILRVALDLSPEGEALHDALLLWVRRMPSLQPDARIAVVNVIRLAVPGIDLNPDMGSDSLRVARLVRLRAWGEGLGLGAAQLTFSVPESADPATAIIDHAHAIRADRVLMGARGASSTLRCLGSVSARVVAEARCSVTVIRQVPVEAEP